MTEKATQPSARWAKLVAITGVVVGYVAFGAMSAIPIIATAAWIGSAKAFVVMGLIYGIGSYVITMWAVGIYERRTDGQPSRAAEWFEAQKDHNMKDGKKSWLWRTAETGGILGFALACFFLGSIITVFLVNYGTKVENVKRLALTGAAIFAVTYAGFYSGLFELVRNR